MKPRAIELSAFGPFGGEVRVDFDALASRSLFLVHGATGSGKTTLLDAMCFALYGVTSGGDRSPREMRSHQAAAGARTEVTFTFEVRGRTYRVWRCPEQERPRARGKGTTTSKSQVTLQVQGEVDGAEPGVTQAALDLGLETWTEVADKAGDVEQQLHDLMGLSADQFRQVVLLPQGRFREFLLSSSRDRQAILQTLFSIERFAEIEEALKEEVETLRQAMRVEADRQKLLLEQAGVEGGDDPLLLRARLVEQLAQQDQEVLRCSGALDAAHQVAERARGAERARRELGEAEQALTTLKGETAARETEAERLALARRAADATVAWERHRDARQAAQQLAETQRDTEEGLGEARARRDAALAEAEKQRSKDGEREEVSERRRELESLSERIAAFKEACRDTEAAEEQTVQARERVQGGEQTMAEATAAHARAADDLDEARLIAEQLDARKSEYLRVLQLRKTWLRRREVLDVDGGLLERTAKLIDETARTEDAYSAAEAAREAAETTWIRGQAAELARALVAGDACPVCGSTEHPAPADAATGADETGWQRVKARRKEAERIAAELITLKTDAARLDTERKGLSNEIQLLTEQLDFWEHYEREDVDSAVDRAAQRIDEADGAAESLETRKAGVAELAVTLKQAAEHTVAARRELDSARGKAEQSAAVAKERGDGLPQALLDPGALDAALGEVRGALAELERARSEAEKSLAQSELGLATAEEAFRQGKESLAKASAHQLQTREALDGALVQAGLDEDALLAARIPSAEREERERALALWRTALASAEDRRARAQAAFAPLGEGPARDVAEAAEREAGDAHAAALSAQASLKARADHLERALAGVRSAEDRTQALEMRYGLIGRLAEVALGDNKHRMTLQRYVLATLLDEVLQTASERLSQMSNGRFLLRRTQQARPSRRRALGLELSVLDQHTGTERPAATLSGGESFLAALALALGLADAVQARAGGRPLEAIFIDEGFGGLDPEALDLALSALSRLTDSGRVVGIISHVAELRERIDARLHVKGGRRGSRIEAFVP